MVSLVRLAVTDAGVWPLDGTQLVPGTSNAKKEDAQLADQIDMSLVSKQRKAVKKRMIVANLMVHSFPLLSSTQHSWRLVTEDY